MRTAIYPGSFDPVTLGHLNIIKRASAIFDKVIVCVLVNSSKKGAGLFGPEERVKLIQMVTSELHNVEVDFSTELLASYAKKKKAKVLVKGLRAMSDYEEEVQMALINSTLYPMLDTVFLPSSPKYTYISSSVVKEMARYGADLSDFLPREIIDEVKRKTGAEEN
jgi:pantetheine-phosphate adenylyltransferase